MYKSIFNTLCIAVVVVFFCIGCIEGPTGPQGATGPQGPAGPTGPQGPGGTGGGVYTETFTGIVTDDMLTVSNTFSSLLIDLGSAGYSNAGTFRYVVVYCGVRYIWVNSSGRTVVSVINLPSAIFNQYNGIVGAVDESVGHEYIKTIISEARSIVQRQYIVILMET